MPPCDSFSAASRNSCGGVLPLREQGGLQRRGDEQLEIDVADLRIGVFRRDHFALFGEADLPVHRARRLRENGVIARAAAAPHRAAAPVEEAHDD